MILQRPGGERNIVARADIDSVTSTGRSLMPDGFGKQLSTTDMADLITFLKSRKLPLSVETVTCRYKSLSSLFVDMK